MTICIAALAEDNKKAVLISDKLVTTNGILPYQIDMAAEKIIKINEDVYLMWCGGVSDASIIIKKVQNNLGDNRWASEIANLVNEKHLEYLLEILSLSQLKTRGIKDVNEFYREYILKLDENTRRNIDTVLTTHTLNSLTQFIICGKESDGNYAIFWLNTNPRFLPIKSTNNFSFIGSGSTWANFSIIQSQYKNTLTISQVIEILRKAKKEAENDQNVGKNEDIIVLD